MKVSYKGKSYTLTQDAHCDVATGVDYQWQATAIDDDGNDCLVVWRARAGFDGDDCSDACDWDSPLCVIR